MMHHRQVTRDSCGAATPKPEGRACAGKSSAGESSTRRGSASTSLSSPSKAVSINSISSSSSSSIIRSSRLSSARSSSSSRRSSRAVNRPQHNKSSSSQLQLQQHQHQHHQPHQHQQHQQQSSTSSSSLLSVLAWSMTLLLVSSCLGIADAGTLMGRPFSKRSFMDIQCKGVYDKSLFARLDRICEDCYNLFREPQLHTLCRKNCFTSDYFKGCLDVLLLQDEMEWIQTSIKQLHGADPGV